MKKEKDKSLQTELEDEEYSQFIGLFDKDAGNFIKVDVGYENRAIGDINKPEINREFEDIVNNILTLNIKMMSTSVHINGKTEYFTTEKAGNTLSKEEQVKKIVSIVKTFDELVIVHSEKELRELQKEYQKKHGTKKTVEQPGIEDTNVYIRITEKDYDDIKTEIQQSHINIAANKVRTRTNDKQGINIVASKKDASAIRDIIIKNNKQILQEVEGNTDWKDIKNSRNIYNNVTSSSLETFQKENDGMFNYIAFKNGEMYTIYVDENCNIPIEGEKRKTLADVEFSVKDYKEANVSEKNENKDKENER